MCLHCCMRKVVEQMFKYRVHVFLCMMTFRHKIIKVDDRVHRHVNQQQMTYAIQEGG
jgi:hypothetical protein